MADNDGPQLSVVVPIFNEAGNILPLAAEIRAALDGICRFEILFVDDGSSDASAAELQAAQKNDSAVRVFRHRKRAGKSAALFTAFHAARAPWIQTLDGDRQNDPADVAKVWRALPPDSIGVVCGRRKRRNDGAVKWLSSRIANAVRRTLLRDDTPDTGCGFKLLRRDVAVRLPYFDGLHRFLPALVRRSGYGVSQVMVEDRPRTVGQSKYGFFGRLAVGIFDLFGVFWLLRRSNVIQADEISESAP
ncbi:MAG TPA: glycosyltransferase family 2 protein [Rhizomicrobium sp.]|jgi:glycosyltransferase involved in cell wall biosynthesis|nr:glycosyltransferase family 2 protein [Rhizomicrobium sp.]